jgi:hypothetical protein
MPLTRVVVSLGVPEDGTELDIAHAMRSVGRLPPEPVDPPLWIHLLDWFTLEVQRPHAQQISDMGHIGFAVATWGAPRDECLWTIDRGAAELGIASSRAAVEAWLARYVTDALGPCLSRAGLLRAQPYG